MATFTVYLSTSQSVRKSPNLDAWAQRDECSFMKSWAVEAESFDEALEATKTLETPANVRQLTPEPRATSVGDVIVDERGNAAMVARTGFLEAARVW